MRGASGFAPQNSLGSSETPNFPPRSQYKNKQHLSTFPKSNWSTSSRDSITPATEFKDLSPLSELGNSSDLFSHSTPELTTFVFGENNSNTSTESPIPFVFGVSKQSQTQPATYSKMVNERSPAKAHKPLQHVAPNEQLPPMSQPPYPPNPQSNVSQFGQPTPPQSLLLKMSQKESNMFIQPKSRPEHHRESDRPAHPHLQAVKDKAKEFFNPLMPRAPAEYNALVAAPMQNYNTYTTTKAAPPLTFSSYEGKSGIPSGYTAPSYVDLTMNKYRANEYDYEYCPFVDPAKAQADLKALFEGAFEDEDDMPRTRYRKKRKEVEANGLADKLRVLDIDEEEKLVVEEEEEDDGTVEGIKVKLLPHQVEGLDWLIAREMGSMKGKGKAPKGGILADDMGLGKTLQSIALIINNSKPKDAKIIAERKLPSGVEKCTLVVAPLALIRQWELEIKDKVEDSHALRVIVHHGPQRTKRFQDLRKYDVVITTYQILVSEFGNSSTNDNGLKVGCFGLHWYRVILDEAHTIKNRNAKATQACCALRSEYRWCLTGTPMQNNLDELQSLIKFLRISPYDNLKEFKEQIDQPMKNGRGHLALERLRAVLGTFMKRRTKDILLREGALNPGGKPSAPGEASTTGFKVTERKIVKIAAEFTEEERRFYTRLEARTDASIEEMMSGEKMNYASALVMLLRLRQACNHPKLVGGKLANDTEALAAEGTSSQKTKSASTEVDEMAAMFGNLGVHSRKCEVCQLELGKQAVADGAIRCLDCEADLEAISKKPKSRKHKKEKKDKQRHGAKSESQAVVRKPRNRAIITDSDDEGEGEEGGQEGSWVVPERERGSLNLGKAGGWKDENAEGCGEWLDSDDDSLPDPKDIGSKKKPIALDDSESESGTDEDSGSSSESDDEVEDEFGSGDEQELSTIATSTKITRLLKILGNEISEHKFIVFSQFTSMLDLIEPFLRQKGFKFTRYDGKMRNDLREASLNSLRTVKSCRILLCSLKCGSLGLNLTAATRVVILEPFWNPFVEEQAIDRVHRLTQKIDVIVYKITISNSVEERILDLQEKKRELAKQAIEGGQQGGIGKLGMKEILSLFKHDAEHSYPVRPAHLDLHTKPRILKEMGATDSSQESIPRERKVTPQVRSGTAKEDSIYGRRW